ncbi:hypothetical protein L596_001445 [Steinernema carpocapsae]|uniref:Uncharacterized protein n=1 Tax=Steinernema carpocapsae TaxID=34508 RepID=A0A4U8ULH1_STECR|nr:hypothetical protein L596_001445 [Steinernema carpocapsae]
MWATFLPLFTRHSNATDYDTRNTRLLIHSESLTKAVMRNLLTLRRITTDLKISPTYLVSNRIASIVYSRGKRQVSSKYLSDILCT